MQTGDARLDRHVAVLKCPGYRYRAAWVENIAAYLPSWANSSSWSPTSMAWPFSITTMTSAIRTVEKRWEMNTGLVLGHLRELFIESVLAKGIQCRRGLVENENLRVTHEGAGNREVLPLASGEIDALVEGLAENRFVAVGQPTDDVMGGGLLGGGLRERSLVNGVEADMS